MLDQCIPQRLMTSFYHSVGFRIMRSCNLDFCSSFDEAFLKILTKFGASIYHYCAWKPISINPMLLEPICYFDCFEGFHSNCFNPSGEIISGNNKLFPFSFFDVDGVYANSSKNSAGSSRFHSRDEHSDINSYS